jgi:fructoselysine transporter
MGRRAGPLMSFLFVWQTCLLSSLVVASGAIGFAQYFNYLVPLSFWEEKAVSAALVMLITALALPEYPEIGKISVFLWAGVIITMLWIIISGFTHRQVAYSPLPSGGESMFSGTFALLVGRRRSRRSIVTWAIIMFVIWGVRSATRAGIFPAAFSSPSFV